MTFPFRLSAAIALLGLFPGLSAAQSGQITGNLDGMPLGFSVSDGVGGMPGLLFEPHTGQGYAELGVMAAALEQTADGIAGVMIFIDFETEEDLSTQALTPDMAQFAEVMVVETWDSAAEMPERVWLAEMDRFALFEIDEISLEGDSGQLAGRITSRRFCLHDMTGGEPVAIRRDGAMICKPGAVHFALASDAAATPPAPEPLQMEVMGRITGMVGYDSYEWITILPAGGAPTVTLDRSSGSDLLTLQAHYPASADFMRADVLSVTIAGDTATGEIPNEGSLPVELAFFTGEPGVYYSAQDGEGEMMADYINFYEEDGKGEIAMTLEGRICRVENAALVADDCKAFEARVATELVLVEGN